MMGWLNHDQGEFFYSFRLDDAVRTITQLERLLRFSTFGTRRASALLSEDWAALIYPALMIRMLIVGYAFAIRSERASCREMRVNLAYRWFCGLSIEDKIPDH